MSQKWPKTCAISFNVFCYNGQPHIQINYADGSSKQISGFVTTAKTTKKTTKKTSSTTRKPAVVAEEVTYVLNVRSGKFHKPGCSSVTDMALYNRKDVTWTRDEVIAAGYELCQRCHP